MSLDGHKYTFNGHGEFTLLQSTDESVNVQLRMVKPVTNDSLFEDEGGTVVTALAAKHKHSDTVQFELIDNKLVAMVNGDLVDFNKPTEQDFKNLTVIAINNITIAAELATGITITVKDLTFLLEVTLTVFDTYYYKTRGLFGLYSGAKKDDLLPKNTTTPLPLNSSLEKIHYKFGLTCKRELNMNLCYLYIYCRDY